jgi:ribosomal protein S21
LAEVRRQEGESLENKLRRFKQKVQQEDVIKEVKRHFFLPEAWREEAGKRSACPQMEL